MRRSKLYIIYLVFFIFCNFLLTSDVFAKRIDFSKVVFGFGFWGGASFPPSTTLTPVPQSKTPEYVIEYGGELIIPVDRTVYLRPLYGVQSFSHFSGYAADPTVSLNYTQSAKGRMRMIGGKLSVNVWISEDNYRRLYVGGGGGTINLKANLERTYDNRTQYLSDANGSAVYWEIHTGIAWMLVQNYSFSLEGGFRGYTIKNLSYAGSKDLANNTIIGPKTIYLANGKRAEFSSNQPFIIGVLNFNF